MKNIRLVISAVCINKKIQGKFGMLTIIILPLALHVICSGRLASCLDFGETKGKRKAVRVMETNKQHDTEMARSMRDRSE